MTWKLKDLSLRQAGVGRTHKHIAARVSQDLIAQIDKVLVAVRKAETVLAAEAEVKVAASPIL
jgi:hypothetical protein